jgi:uncharacterized protein YigE (DUF2233 family)
MKITRKNISYLIILIGLIVFFAFTQNTNQKEAKILSYIIDLKKQEIEFFLKDEENKKIKTFKVLKDWLKTKNKTLIFAMNGGMFKTDFSPQGLYVEKGILITKINTIQNGYGNFYMQPNGIFYITNDKQGKIVTTKNFKNKNVKFATQSGPMLLINGQIHNRFMKGSSNLNIRNGVGILPDGKILFAMSKEKINFYDFATYFKRLGCMNALYLDGFVSKTYLPSKGYKELNGNFGVIIGEVKDE